MRTSVLIFSAPLLMALLCSTNANAEARLTVHTDQTGPVIERNVYGHFIEHLGRAIYDGIWVGEESDIPNTRGWRNDVVEALKAIRVPVLRWPGGCFADTYHWRDGIGPRDQRPSRVNILWGEIQESNAVGTHEYFDLVEQLGAEAYVNGNLGTGTPREMADWVEYMTSSSPYGLASERIANGREKPFKLHHFGIGNESWGCGGGMSPEYYTSLYKHYSTFLRTPWTYPIQTQWIASGGHGYGDDVNAGGMTEWTDYLTENIEPDFLLGFNAVSFHYYTHPQGTALSEKKGPASGFPETQWISTLARTLLMDGYLEANRKVLDRNDPDNSVAFYVDEWGSWYDPTPDTNPAFLEQATTLRDALVTGLNFHIFHRHADRVTMTSPAQMVNVLQAPVITRGNDMVLTPTYYAYKMHVPFQGATRLDMQLKKVPKYSHAGQSIPALSATAAVSEDHGVVIGLINTDPHQSHTLRLNLTGSKSESEWLGEVLTAKTMDAYNTFSEPQVITPRTVDIDLQATNSVITVPAKSMMVIRQK
ncbi:alpha-N-arabinofuranosidase [Halieaceae bacterium IMCC14734]|uniref:non-reducing end alpha-L-arabinofuranosidase n=1 Tax=Candidatus Litorirhabdus singularis TaxID=2518993 RepID=A0ABT3TAJ2_9GAMM|nr:alpha-L-arabinofuranosidase C-terminal domain-containing protein [Candidatus Litorirhabdus singularis]MCX2979318.1 alpha-N-arabinofuranosidase [Candidatus Litorirhabdus singularis]